MFISSDLKSTLGYIDIEIKSHIECRRNHTYSEDAEVVIKKLQRSRKM